MQQVGEGMFLSLHVQVNCVTLRQSVHQSYCFGQHKLTHFKLFKRQLNILKQTTEYTTETV